MGPDTVAPPGFFPLCICLFFYGSLPSYSFWQIPQTIVFHFMTPCYIQLDSVVLQLGNFSLKHFASCSGFVVTRYTEYSIRVADVTVENPDHFNLILLDVTLNLCYSSAFLTLHLSLLHHMFLFVTFLGSCNGRMFCFVLPRLSLFIIVS